MLSPGYFDFRWSWYRPILNRGEDIAVRCKVDVRRLPVRYTAEDGQEYLPYAMDASQLDRMTTALRRLQDYSFRYMIDQEKVSAHQLPVLNPVGRAIMKHLQTCNPHLPQSLLHHWCADQQGALVLFDMWQSMWKQSWKQDQVDHAPWVASVNILILKMIRQAIQRLSSDHAEHTDHILVSVAGGLYDWALRRFLKQHVDGAVEVTRIATYESMVIPVTPIAFLYRQPEDALLGDDRFVIMSYGLEADIVPRMREIRAKVGNKYESGICPLLAEDRMGAHMLRRSWVRLALWELAEKTRQGVWMQWVLQAKKLDQLISRPETLPKAAVDLLKQSVEFPIAAWILARLNPKTKKAADLDTPWLKDERVLQAFRVFEEDVAIEQRRRKAEVVWMDRHAALAGKGRGKEIEQALNQAWESGLLIYFQNADASLHSGSSLSAKQACLRIDWANYLYITEKVSNHFESLVKDKLTATIFQRMQQAKNIFMDSINGTGCVLRGDVVELLHEGYAIYRFMHELYVESSHDDDETSSHAHTSKRNKIFPSPSICMTMQGDWTVINGTHPAWGEFRIASGAAMAQANAGLAHDENIARLIAWRNKKANKLSLGGLHIEGVDIGGGNMLPILHNQGFAVTDTVMQAYEDTMQQSAPVKKLSLDRSQAEAIFAKYRVMGDIFEITTVIPHEDDMLLFTKVGVTRLNDRTTEMYELLEPTSEAANLIRSEMLMSWVGL